LPQITANSGELRVLEISDRDHGAVCFQGLSCGIRGALMRQTVVTDKVLGCHAAHDSR